MRRRGVGLLIGTVAILAGLGLAALTRAQPPVAKAPPADRAELRARVVALRAEAEWLELEREIHVDRSEISSLNKSIQEKAGLIEFEAGATSDPAAMAAGFGVEKGKVSGWYEDQVKERGIKKRPGEDAYAALLRTSVEECETYVKEHGIEKHPGETANAAIVRVTIRKECGASLDALDQIKRGFLRQSKVLNEKRLDLAEAERQYNESR